MRRLSIGYLALDSLASPGVTKKIRAKAAAIGRTGAEVKCFIFSQGSIDKSNVPPEPYFFLYELPDAEVSRFYHSRFTHRFQKFSYYKRMYSFVHAEVSKHSLDFLVVRYPGADLSLWWLVLKLRAKVVFEFNSIAVNELKLRRGYYLNRYYINSERFVAPLVISSSYGIIGVTDEITGYYAQRSIIRKRNATTINNAIDVHTAQPVPSGNFRKGVVNIIVVIGSGVTDWYGLDRLFGSLAAYTGSTVFNVHLVGEHLAGEYDIARKIGLNNVSYVGVKTQAELAELYPKMDVGMAALAMYRIGLSEACSLKVREYCLHGLPVFCGYRECGFDGLSPKAKFIHELPNRDEPVDLDRLAGFVEQFHAEPANMVTLSDYVKHECNYDKKASELVSFLSKDMPRS